MKKEIGKALMYDLVKRPILSIAITHLGVLFMPVTAMIHSGAFKVVDHVGPRALVVVYIEVSALVYGFKWPIRKNIKPRIERLTTSCPALGNTCFTTRFICVIVSFRLLFST